MRITGVYLVGQAWSLTVYAHILRTIGRRFPIRDSDGIYVWLTRAHGASIKIGSITLPFSLLNEILFKFLIC